jgi:hypothetical protein
MTNIFSSQDAPHREQGGGKVDGYGNKPTFSIFSVLTLGLTLALAIYPSSPPVVSLGLGLLFLFILLISFLSSHAPIVCRCILPILLGAICVEAYILIQQSEYASPITRYFVFGDTYNEIFYSGLATLYAIITALALVKGIEGFDAMMRIISDEAYKVRAIFELTHYFDTDQDQQTHDGVQGLRKKLLRYAGNVARLRDQKLTNENLRILRECQTEIAKLEPRDANDGYSLQIIVANHVELGVLRSKRISSVGEKIPRYLIAALWLMALSLILPFMAEPLTITEVTGGAVIDNPARFGQYYIIFLLGALNSFLLLMLSDISDPFDGFWKVTLDPFDELKLALEHEMTKKSDT